MPGEASRIVTHLHGGENLPQRDGTPLQWFPRSATRAPTSTPGFQGRKRERELANAVTAQSAAEAAEASRRGIAHGTRNALDYVHGALHGGHEIRDAH